MRPVLSRTQMQAFDRQAIEYGKLPSLLLMENAGRGAAELLLEQFRGVREVLVCAGRGNNGGDGWVLARHLSNQGLQVRVFTDNGAPTTQDAKVMREAFEALGGQLQPLTAETVRETCQKVDPTRSVLVDAIFGTGLSRPVRGELLDVLRVMNQLSLPVVSLDIPSGLDADSGSILGEAVRAKLTVCFGHLKLGLLTPIGTEHVGQLRVTDIGAPKSLVDRAGYSALIADDRDLAGMLAKRPVHSHKVNSGRVMIVAGSPGKLGAAHLVARGALRAGAGLVTLVNTREVIRQLEGRLAEVMTEELEDDQPASSLPNVAAACHALAMGPGLGVNDTTYSLVRAALALPCVKVLDADALSVFAGRITELRDCNGEVIITPHPGEAGRLLGISAAQVEANRFEALEQLVAQSRASVLLKGPHTLVGAPNRVSHIARAGSPVLATGGAGDVLTGIVAAISVQMPAFGAAYLGASLHALAGERWQARHATDRGLLASEIADELPAALAQLSSVRQQLTD